MNLISFEDVHLCCTVLHTVAGQSEKLSQLLLHVYFSFPVKDDQKSTECETP